MSTRNGVSANDLRVIAKVPPSLKTQVVKTSAAMGVTEAEFLRRVLAWYFDEKGRGEERIRDVVGELRSASDQTQEAIQTLFPMIELMAKVLFMRIPVVTPETLEDREREATRLFDYWQKQLLERLSSQEPSSILALIGESCRAARDEELTRSPDVEP